MVTLFMGHPVEYWTELRARVEKENLGKLLEDFVILNAKVMFYEAVFDDISRFRNKADTLGIHDKT